MCFCDGNVSAFRQTCDVKLGPFFIAIFCLLQARIDDVFIATRCKEL